MKVAQYVVETDRFVFATCASMEPIMRRAAVVCATVCREMSVMDVMVCL